MTHERQPSDTQPRRSYSSQTPDEDLDLSTIPDPRSRTMSPATGEGSIPEHHPDLDDEVAALSNKLINAINHQTTLDDSLSSTRQELNQSQQRIHHLEELVAEQREMLAGDVWIKRKTSEAEKGKLVAAIALEKRLRLDAEQQRKKIELELETLTTALFEEANKMVITAKEEAREREEALQRKAREEQDAIQRKNDMLKAQLADTEGLLKSQSEQLSELKHVLEVVNTELDDQASQTSPLSPGLSKFGKSDAKYDESTADNASRSGADAGPVSPSYPTSFTHLLHPVLRTDLTSFTDFRELIRTSKRVSGHRAPSGLQNSSLAALALGQSGLISTGGNGSTTSLSTTGTQSAPQTPNTPASSVSFGSAGAPVILPPLKDTKFYKRALVEDIEPTLRLDLAPGLSWLARRNVLAAITDGSLVVEPIPSTLASRFRVRPQFDPCSLCGEYRRDEEHLRTHRFRTSESDSANRYALCKHCLNRLRSTCDYISFLRILKDGHWHVENDDSEKAAWEESVRLREQMFWNRIGGGVVPVTPGHHTQLERSGVEESPANALVAKANQDQASTPSLDQDQGDATISGTGTGTTIEEEAKAEEETQPRTPENGTTTEEEVKVEEEAQPRTPENGAAIEEEQAQTSIPETVASTVASTEEKATVEVEAPSSTQQLEPSPIPGDSVKDEPTKLSLTIPGAFEPTP